MKKNYLIFISIVLLSCLCLFTACNGKTAKTTNASSVTKTNGDNSVKSESSANPVGTFTEFSTDISGEKAFEFELSKDKKSYSVVKYNGLEEEISIPSTYLGKPIEVIGFYAFYDCNTIKKVVLPDTIKKIDLCAFNNCQELENINLPNSITEISSSAFKNCRSLKTVNLPNGLLKLGNEAFSFSSIESLTLPNSLKYIGEETFSACFDLQSVKFENDSGWFVSTDKNATTGTLVSVTDPTANAEMLKNTYRDYYWICN